MQKQCFNCGVVLTPPKKDAKRHSPSDATREHVPGRSLFSPLDSRYKVNNITVDCCFKCNNSFSTYDEEFRNAIGIMSEANQDLEKIAEKSVESLVRKKALEKNRLTILNGNVTHVEFDSDIFRVVYEKNFKALFIHTFGYKIPSEYKIVHRFIPVGGKEADVESKAESFFKNNSKYKISGSEFVFKYAISELNEIVPDYTPSINSNTYICSMIYFNKLKVLIIATSDVNLLKHMKRSIYPKQKQMKKVIKSKKNKKYQK